MELKLIAALASGEKSERLIEAAREAGATGATAIGGGRGEGLNPARTFFGLNFDAPCDLLLFVVSARRARAILECLRVAGRFDEEPGTGIAFLLNIEDAVGLTTQMGAIESDRVAPGKE